MLPDFLPRETSHDAALEEAMSLKDVVQYHYGNFSLYLGFDAINNYTQIIIPSIGNALVTTLPFLNRSTLCYTE